MGFQNPLWLREGEGGAGTFPQLHRFDGKPRIPQFQHLANVLTNELSKKCQRPQSNYITLEDENAVPLHGTLRRWPGEDYKKEEGGGEKLMEG